VFGCWRLLTSLPSLLSFLPERFSFWVLPHPSCTGFDLADSAEKTSDPEVDWHRHVRPGGFPSCDGTMGVMPRTWLPDRSVASVRSALRRHAPELSDGDVVRQSWIEQSDPNWWDASAVVDKQFFVKFAWSEPAAQKVWHEARILQVLGSHSSSLCTPLVIAASDDPALLVTKWIGGDPLAYELVRGLDRPRLEYTANELARFLSELHCPEVVAHVRQAVGPLSIPLPQATTEAIREHLTPWLRSDQLGQVREWCDWADRILAVPVETVFVHGDFHGYNQVWDHERQTLTAIIDFEESGLADPAYDFRYLPSQGPGTDLFVATATKYGVYTGVPIDVSRVMAWHIRTVLGDALWRSRAGVPLPDGGSPAEWTDALRCRLDEIRLR
jgi:aminoglycoside phosphotransferase (APT) family kinase protein